MAESVATAAKALDKLRQGWLNPESGDIAELNSRTLTNLYNQRPNWLAHAHNKIDRAVFTAYGWPYPLDEQEILKRLLQLNKERAAQFGGMTLPTDFTEDTEE